MTPPPPPGEGLDRKPSKRDLKNKDVQVQVSTIEGFWSGAGGGGDSVLSKGLVLGV